MMRHEGPCTNHWSPMCWSSVTDGPEPARNFAAISEGACPGCSMTLERAASGLARCVVCGVEWGIEATGAGEAELTMRFTVNI